MTDENFIDYFGEVVRVNEFGATITWQHFKFPPQAAQCKGVLPAPNENDPRYIQVGKKRTFSERMLSKETKLVYLSNPLMFHNGT